MPTSSAPGDLIRLIYVVGVSRSGSTILDALLGSHPGIAATGEIYLFSTDDHGEPRHCACGQPIESCGFWGPILRDWQSELHPATMSDYHVLQKKYERLRHIPRLLRTRTRQTPEFARYARWTTALLRRICRQANGDVIADSSKHPPRALAVLSIDEINTSLIHILRDPRGVVWSKLKFFRPVGAARRFQSPLGLALLTTLEWLVLNLATELVRRRYPRVPYVRVRYEDLTDQPERELQRLGEKIGRDLTDLGRRVAAGEPFGFGHIMAGNTARHRGPRPVVKDIDWQENAPTWVRRLVWWLTFPLARHYGYRR